MSPDLSTTHLPGGSMRRNLLEITQLAMPMVVSRGGNTLLVATNVVMVGHTGAEQLALQGVGFAIATTLQMTGLGLLTGTLVSVAAAHGASHLSECGQVWRRSLPYALVLGTIGVVISFFTAHLLRLIGQSTSFAAEAGHIAFIVGCSLPAFMLFTTTSYFLEGIGRPVPGMIMTICAVVANVGLNWVFVYGHLGSRALGAEGAAFATLIVRVLLALGVMGFVLLFREATHFGIREPWRGSWRSWALQRRIGHADGVSMGIESGAFTSMNLMASILGTAHIAAYAIAISVSSIVFTVALGVASATAVLVGRSVGRHDWRELRRAGWLGLGLNSTIIACISMVLLVWPEWIVGLYSTDKSVARIAVPLILIIAAALIADGGQRVLALSLRGCADTWLPTALHLLSYAGIMVPLGWVLAFPLGLASAGLVLAIAIASLVSVTVLASRFWWLSSIRLQAVLAPRSCKVTNVVTRP